ncbi:hypothetical protein [Spiroplasma phoeniceum]|uniref:Uncharacterized protein n=1 Tax=Spiroplasma phoeniceum P40 TaxID=1276259 RepID=A0A345DRH8_9MOLU|nr:hypothetical protein [Spiroplasma phoeniceum]AXF96819.1 hypothetical protein SDAV_001875 [Spiroplasma phoeniceum P40]
MAITKSIKFNKLQEENEKLKNKLIEKNKEIEELKYKQLFEEDFDNIYIQSNIHNFSELEWNYFQKYNFFCK